MALSARSKSRSRLTDWKSKVADAALLAWPTDRDPIESDVDVHISEFSAFGSPDRDNMSKPILDAMQHIVYFDDRQVKRLRVEWCDINGAYRVRYMSPVVAEALSTGAAFVWIRVWPYAHTEDLIR